MRLTVTLSYFILFTFCSWKHISRILKETKVKLAVAPDSKPEAKQLESQNVKKASKNKFKSQETAEQIKSENASTTLTRLSAPKVKEKLWWKHKLRKHLLLQAQDKWFKEVRTLYDVCDFRPYKWVHSCHRLAFRVTSRLRHPMERTIPKSLTSTKNMRKRF